MRSLDSYLAGLFDGEGWVSAQHRVRKDGKPTKHTRLIVGVGMRTKEPLVMMHKRFGGSLKRYGKMWQWYVCSSNAIEPLSVFSDLCVIKAEQCRLAIALIALISSTGHRANRANGDREISPMEDKRRMVLASKITLLKKYADA